MPAPAMVRKAAGPVKPQAAAPMPARVPQVHVEQEQEQVCPLCIEELDKTDLEFEPCPCGYRICLFCYSKLQELCASTCPNCRRGYGSAEAAEFAKQQVERQAAEEKARSAPRAAAAPATAHVITGATAPGLNGKAALAGPAPMRGLGAAHARKPPEHAAHAKRVDEAGLPSASVWAAQGSSVRQLSVEVAPAEPRPPARTGMDAMDWPSLGGGILAPPPPPPPPGPSAFPPLQAATSGSQTHKHRNDERAEQSNAKRSSSHATSQAQQAAAAAAAAAAVAAAGPSGRADPDRAAAVAAAAAAHSGVGLHTSMDSSSMESRVTSSASLDHMSQDPPITPEQLQMLQAQHQLYQAQHAAPLIPSASYGSLASVGQQQEQAMYFSAQVQTTVHGIRRSIAVPLSPGGPLLEPYPEAQAILANMQSAIKAGTATAADAAQQLMALLQRQRDPSVMDSVMGRTRSTKPAPPGFGPTVNPIGPPGAGLQQQPYSALINGPVRPPPPGFGGPSLAPPPASTAGPAESAAANGLPPAGSLRPTALHQPMPPPGFANAAPSLSKPMGTTMPVTSQSSSQGYYSLWNGLPGFGLGGGLGGGGLGGGGLVSGGLTLGLGGGLWATQGQAPINGGGLGGGGYGAGPVPPPQENAQHSMSFSGGSPMATKAPPPGFGPAAHTGAGSSYQPFGNNTASASSRYNPLEYATGGVSGFGRT